MQLKDVPIGTRLLLEPCDSRGPAVLLGESGSSPGYFRVRFDRPLAHGYVDLVSEKRIKGSHIDGWRGDVEVTVLPALAPDDNTPDA